MATPALAVSILQTQQGGTGWGFPGGFQANTVLLGNGTGAIATTSAGSNGQVLALVSGVPTWTATSSIQNLTATYPLQILSNILSLAFGTTTSNTWAGTQTFTNAPTLTSLATAAGTFLAANASGVIIATTSPQPAGNYITALTGDVTATGPGSVAATIGANKVTLGMLATLAANSVIGNATGAIATPTAVATSSLFTWTGTGDVVRATSPTIITPSIAALANLTSNGYVKTSGGVGTLGVQAVPIPIADGGTAATSFTTSGNSVYYNGSALLTAPTTSFVTTPYASTTALSSSGSAYFATSAGSVGIGTASPTSKFAVNNGSDSLYNLAAFYGASATAYGVIGQSSAITALTAASTGSDSTQLSFRTSNAGVETEAMRIFSTGDINIGATDDSARFRVTGTYTTANANAIFLDVDLASSVTSSQYGVRNDQNFSPSGASLSNLYGQYVNPNLSSSATPVASFYGQRLILESVASYTGLVTTGYALRIDQPTWNSPQPMGIYYGAYIDAGSNGNGTTTGTIINYAQRLIGPTADPGLGGTITGRTLFLNVPSGSGDGTANNFGIQLTGNGGSGGTGATTNWAFYSDSTAKSSWLGPLTIGNNLQSHGSIFTISTTSVDTSRSQLALTSHRVAIVSGNLVGGEDFVSNDTNLTASGLRVAAFQAVAAATHTASVLTTDLTWSSTSVLAYAELMRLTGAGRLGIGTSTPPTLFSIQGASPRSSWYDTDTSEARTFTGALEKTFTYATTTWAGTTTIPMGPAWAAQKFSGVKCFTDTGTLNVSLYDGTNRANLLNASTTVGTFSYSSNNTFTASEKRYIDIGTPASSPRSVSCTFRYYEEL